MTPVTAQQKINELDLKRYRYAYLPSLVAYGSYQRNAQRTKFDFFDSEQKWFPIGLIGATLNVPIFSGGQKYYRIQQAKLNLVKTNNTMIYAKSAIDMETSAAAILYKNAYASLQTQAKNKELAVSTMSLIKKNELLALIKEDLKKSSDETSFKSIKSVITTTINKNISVDNAWSAFKEAFDTADKDFLKKVKQVHESLTPNDLRLCAYLRLNLSSKEIAPLLNISVRSVEIKRYRLRKKMDLPHEARLVDYILSI